LSQIASVIRCGFTGHEMVGGHSMGLIHMNGRVFDSKIGRFLSADPFVQKPFFSQSLNRYSYLFNNPFSGTDPTGFFNGEDRPSTAKWVVLYEISDFAAAFQRGWEPRPDFWQQTRFQGLNYQVPPDTYVPPRPANPATPPDGTTWQAGLVGPSVQAGGDLGSTAGGVPGQNLSDALYYPGYFPVARLDMGIASPLVNGSLNLVNGLANGANDLFGWALQPFDTYGGEIISAETALPGGGIAAGPTILLGNISRSIRLANASRGPAATLELAQEIATHAKQTISIMETAEGPTLVAGGVRDLSAAQKALAVERGLTPVELPGFHAEKTLIHAAGERGLTPTRGVSTNNICGGSEGCRTFLEGLGAIVDGRFFSF